MILVDTSVWVDHFSKWDGGLAKLLDAGQVLTHPFVLGELALGNLRQRQIMLDAIADQPTAATATDAEARPLIPRNELFGRGVGYVDVHLLASVRLTGSAQLWTRDKRLRQLALGLSSSSADESANLR